MFPWTFSQFAHDLSQFDEPNTLYSFMQSMVNYGKDESEQVKIKDLPENARVKIFDFDYPLASDLKADFEKIFLSHYMFRRINYDTFTSFKIHLMVKLNEIMPKYDKMIAGFNKINFDGNVETHTRTEHNTKNSTNSSTSSIDSNTSDESESDVKYSDTPEGQLTNIKNGTYMSEYTLNSGESSGESHSDSTNESESNDVGDVEENITIKRADSIEEYQKYLEIVSNIYSLIFKECDCLFYGLI